jgi:hypothetical protein
MNLLNLKEYTQSLDEYLKIGAKVIIPGHDPPQSDMELLVQNLNYIRNVASGHIDLAVMSQHQLRAHYPNTVRLPSSLSRKPTLKRQRSTTVKR